MYCEAVAQSAQNLESLLTCLDKAAQHAAAKKFDVDVLATSRLAPDMQPLTYQIQNACDYVKGAAAWLSGQTPPRHEDNERTIEELRARIRKTVDFCRSVPKEKYTAASAQKIKLSWAPAGTVIGGGLSAADRDPQRLLPHGDGLRDPAPQRRRRRQARFSRPAEFREGVSCCPDRASRNPGSSAPDFTPFNPGYEAELQTLPSS